MLPDLIGYKLDDATAILKAEGFNDIVVHLTKSPREEDKQSSSESRVVRLTILEDKKVDLILCN